MIDMHCHIIPGIDDGSRHIESTIKMVKRASDLGYDAIFATSHFIEDSHETKSNEIHGSVKALNEVFCYVDDVNPAINYNSPYLCKECYEKRYGKNR